MCSPPLIMAAMAGGEWYMQDQQAKAGQKAATHSLRVGQQSEASRQDEESRAAAIERDKITRKSLISKGQLAAIGAKRGLSQSAALSQMFLEFGMREAEYQSAISAKRDQQLVAGAIRDSGRVATWRGRMAQNKRTGLAGLGLSVAAAYLGTKAMAGKTPDIGGAFEGYSNPGINFMQSSSINPYDLNFNPMNPFTGIGAGGSPNAGGGFGDWFSGILD